MEIFTRESGNQKGYNLSDRKNTRISLWSYFGGRSMASSLEHFCLIKDSVTLGLNREVINYEEKILADIIQYRRFYFILTVIVQLCKRHGRLFFILALAVFGEIAARAFIECKYLQESPEIKEDTAYRITKVLRLLCEIILIIGVWRIRFK